MRSAVSLLAICLASSSVVCAQIKGTFHETAVCGKSAVHQTVLINDDRQHSISLDQRPCTSREPIEIGGLKSSEYVTYGVDDVQNGRSIDRGYGIGTMANGDRYFLAYNGTATMNGNVPVHLEGTWTFTGGTGRLKPLKGGGSYTAHPTADGGMEFVIEGSYELPAAK